MSCGRFSSLISRAPTGSLPARCRFYPIRGRRPPDLFRARPVRRPRRPAPRLAPPQQLEQLAIGRRIRGNQLVLDVRARQLAPRLLEEPPQLSQVALPDLPRLRVDLPLVLHREEARRAIEREAQPLPVERGRA